MKKVNNKCIFMLGMILGLVISVSSVYAVEAYIESNKVSYDNSKSKGSYKEVQSSIDELYERSGIHKEKWIDPILNGADPVLKDPLIPVEIKPNGDVYYANLNSEWYNYSEKRWANAVILNNEKSSSNYQDGQEILNEDIKGYFVWIPRYRYKVWNMGSYTSAPNASTLNNGNYNTSPAHLLGNARIIEIEFESKDTKKSVASKIGDYQTHPAFKIEGKELSGIWVGKFETGGTSANDMVVKPNEISWRIDTIKTFFNAAKSFDVSLKSHLLKNTEWGATAYLSHSIYGIGNEVKTNNASDFKTGYAAAPNTDQSTRPSDSAESSDKSKTQPWNSETGYLASTTGNISGIYDMSGGNYEYVAAYRKGIANSDGSGFSQADVTAQVNLGYIDEYSADSGITTYNKRILGDATGEMGPFYRYYDGDGEIHYHNSWYGDYGIFASSSTTWFLRGGSYKAGVLSGQFAFQANSGAGSTYDGFRIALAIN